MVVVIFWRWRVPHTRTGPGRPPVVPLHPQPPGSVSNDQTASTVPCSAYRTPSGDAGWRIWLADTFAGLNHTLLGRAKDPRDVHCPDVPPNPSCSTRLAIEPAMRLSYRASSFSTWASASCSPYFTPAPLDADSLLWPHPHLKISNCHHHVLDTQPNHYSWPHPPSSSRYSTIRFMFCILSPKTAEHQCKTLATATPRLLTFLNPSRHLLSSFGPQLNHVVVHLPGLLWAWLRGWRTRNDIRCRHKLGAKPL